MIPENLIKQFYYLFQTVEEHSAMSFVQIVKQWRRTSKGREGSIVRTTLLKYYPKKSVRDGKYMSKL